MGRTGGKREIKEQKKSAIRSDMIMPESGGGLSICKSIGGKIPSAELIQNGFLHVTMKLPNSYGGE